MSAVQLLIQQGKDLCNAWRGKTDNEKGTAIGGLKGFLIPEDAVTDLKTNPDVEGIRVYLAYDDVASEVKLVVVGTKANAAGEQEDIIDADPNTKIYDFTEPCPVRCDTTSPLF